jgi:hypothetical protein
MHEIISTILYSWVLLFGIVGLAVLLFLKASIVVKWNLATFYILRKCKLGINWIVAILLLNVFMADKYNVGKCIVGSVFIFILFILFVMLGQTITNDKNYDD